MQKAADISVHAHQLAMQQVKADLFEYEIASIFDTALLPLLSVVVIVLLVCW
jgi:Xaa-Pro aminopeptidase